MDFKLICIAYLTGMTNVVSTFTFTFIPLHDAFIQSDLQLQQ